ncbi:diacylglycerol kinase family protein [Leadbetterella sp. DM7]|uniref:diacylglycerol kinase family protein n=1 Tax=Leadbetterella sp. DM7 TaxID=3235085 RepID=UPI00349EF744
MNVRKMLRSFRYAINGVYLLFKYENNARFHLLAAVGVVSAGVYFGLKPWEWTAVTACIFLVFSAEAFNTALEKLCDRLLPGRDPAVGAVKDLAAAAVLFTVTGAVLVGLLIFGRRLLGG